MEDVDVIAKDDYLYFAQRALDGMAGIVAGLGDELANTRPALPGANSPFALLTHCVGVVDYWSGRLVAGRRADRDRAAEFVAAGPVAPLLAEVAAVRSRLVDDVRSASGDAPLRAEPDRSFQGPSRGLTCGGALQHVYEELAQHHGQMQILRDVIRAGSVTARADRGEPGVAS